LQRVGRNRFGADRHRPLTNDFARAGVFRDGSRPAGKAEKSIIPTGNAKKFTQIDAVAITRSNRCECHCETKARVGFAPWQVIQ
jgi:hypothetical protein